MSGRGCVLAPARRPPRSATPPSHYYYEAGERLVVHPHPLAAVGSPARPRRTWEARHTPSTQQGEQVRVPPTPGLGTMAAPAHTRRTYYAAFLHTHENINMVRKAEQSGPFLALLRRLLMAADTHACAIIIFLLHTLAFKTAFTLSRSQASPPRSYSAARPPRPVGELASPKKGVLSVSFLSDTPLLPSPTPFPSPPPPPPTPDILLLGRRAGEGGSE